MWTCSECRAAFDSTIKKSPFNLCSACYSDHDIIEAYRRGDKQPLIDEAFEQSAVLMELPDDEQYAELKLNANPFIGYHISPLSYVQLDSLLRANFE